MAIDRRSFLQLLSGVLAAGTSESIARALAIPANHQSGTIADVEHVVFLMQENRSFDHYFGTLSGVRGFGDPRAVRLPGGQSVFHQPDEAGGYVLPFRPPEPHLGLRFLKDLAHDWATTHVAWNDGRYDQWVKAKTHLTMAHLQREDIPYHYALADAFTVCDAYHSSLLGPTDPNRYHFFTGWVGNDGVGGGPAIDNAEAGYGWSTFPESLEAAGVSWKIYQDIGLGLTADGAWGNTKNPYIGNYGDNPLLYFDQYRNALPGSALYEKARTGTHANAGAGLFDDFRKDASKGTLPSVSWVAAPEAYTEHPNWPANYGAYYISQILDALTANPSVWSKTVLFVMYDENDGFFDHVVPPTPPAGPAQGLSTVAVDHEIYPGSDGNPSGPYGLGARVPMLVVSPWSRGGWVNSEVFDHTSLIRFVQKRFGSAVAPLRETNITAWRAAVTGDLTSAFDFASPNGAKVRMPSTAGFVPADSRRHEDYVPPAPTTQSLPIQESGMRPARAVPYVLNVSATVNQGSSEVSLEFRNSGSRAAVFQVRSAAALHAPRSYTVEPQSQVRDVWSYDTAGQEGPAGQRALGGQDGRSGQDGYHLAVHGPNGFYRAYRGAWGANSVNVQSSISYDAASGAVTLSVANRGAMACALRLRELYQSVALTANLEVAATFAHTFTLARSFDWYEFELGVAEDPSFAQHLAGHLETGRDGMTDPAIPRRSTSVVP